MAAFSDPASGLRKTSIPTLYLRLVSGTEAKEWVESLKGVGGEGTDHEEAEIDFAFSVVKTFARDAQGAEFDNFKDRDVFGEFCKAQDGIASEIVEAILEAREALGKPLTNRLQRAAQRASST